MTQRRSKSDLGPGSPRAGPAAKVGDGSMTSDRDQAALGEGG